MRALNLRAIDDDAGTGLRQTFRDGMPQTPRGPSDQGRFPMQIE
jgi:hypothetical protein